MVSLGAFSAFFFFNILNINTSKFHVHLYNPHHIQTPDVYVRVYVCVYK